MTRVRVTGWKGIDPGPLASHDPRGEGRRLASAVLVVASDDEAGAGADLARLEREHRQPRASGCLRDARERRRGQIARHLADRIGTPAHERQRRIAHVRARVGRDRDQLEARLCGLLLQAILVEDRVHLRGHVERSQGAGRRQGRADEREHLLECGGHVHAGHVREVIGVARASAGRNRAGEVVEDDRHGARTRERGLQRGRGERDQQVRPLHQRRVDQAAHRRHVSLRVPDGRHVIAPLHQTRLAQAGEHAFLGLGPRRARC